MTTEQKRIWLWCVPRSISTAFVRCMMSRDSCRGYLEPWVLTYYMSADRLSDRFDVPDREGATFKDRKEMFEGEHKGFKEVFVKEQAFRMKTFLASGTVESVIPKGYIHTFLIRHPRKFISSMYLGTLQGHSGFEGFQPIEASFKEMVQMHEYATQKRKQKSVIVDADDLQRDPETTLRLYCEAVGIDYHDSMVHWRPLDEEQYKEFEEWVPWVKLAIESTEFLPKTPSILPEIKDLPEDIQKAIEDAMPFYEELYEKRLRPKQQCKNRISD